MPDLHAFLSQGYVRTTGNNYLFENTMHGTFDFTEVAVNLTEPLTDRLRMGVQLFARNLGGQPGTYQVDIDWAYLDYHFKDWLGFRAGRLKVPFGLYNEVDEIDSAHIPVLLPQSVYPLLNRDLLLAQTGVELYGYVRLGRAGALDYRLYGGTLTADVTPPKGFSLAQFQVPYLGGARLLWEVPIDGLRVGGSVQALRLDEDLSFSTQGGGTAAYDLNIPFVLWLASAEYAAHDWVIAGEYGRWRADVETNLAPTTTTTNSRYYLMAAYHLRSWFTPGLYYAGLEPHLSAGATGNAKYQHDLAATLRFDVNVHWLFKLEGHYISGTADLDSTLNGGVPLSKLAGNWCMLLAKTTVYF
jgi:hypothetical protein